MNRVLSRRRAAPANSSAPSKNPQPGRPVGSRREDTLARVLPAARRLFAEKGFAQTTFKDVAAAVGLTHAALYPYFSNKVELYLATLDDTQALLLPDYLHAISEGKNLREQIAGVLMASAAAHDRDSSVTGFLAAVPIEIRRHPELAEPLAARHDVIYSALEAMFEAARQSGELRLQATTAELISAFLGGGVGVALFQYGVAAAELSGAMDVFVKVLSGEAFGG